MKHARKKFRPLKLRAASRGSGLSDVSENHDYYLALALSEDLADSSREKITEPGRSRQSRTWKK